MVTSLELYKRSQGKNDRHAVVVRFAVNRKNFRIPTGIHFTTQDWSIEQRTGYSRRISAGELDKRIRAKLTHENNSTETLRKAW